MELQKDFFSTNGTRSIAWRMQQLRKLKHSIIKHQDQIIHALHIDLGKPPFEVIAGEIAPILKELDYFLHHLPYLAQPRTVPTPWLLWPATSHILYEPYGVVLIMAPWNFPFQFILMPLDWRPCCRQLRSN